MIVAISLNITDYMMDGEGVPNGDVVYTNKIAVFEYEHPAIEFAKDKPEILLIDCDNGKIIKDANILVN